MILEKATIDFFDDLINQNIIIYFLNNWKFEGRLLWDGYDKYNFANFKYKLAPRVF